VTGPYLVAREASPRLVERGGGAIVNISSVAGLVAGPDGAAYATSKAAVIMLTRSLAVELGPKRIRVNALCPGWVRTPMSERQMDELAAARGVTREQAFALVSADLPLRRVAEPEEIAAACLFLASPEASFITGSVLVADGGSTAVDVGMLAFARP
jgi:NAD(P)-dependent dehydrogenase (short-subunit alcohol dehydrogenase family)